MNRLMLILFFIIFYLAMRQIHFGSVTGQFDFRGYALVWGVPFILALAIVWVVNAVGRFGLVINDDGVNFGRWIFIPWDAIQSISPVSFLGVKCLGIKLKSGKNFVAPSPIRWLLHYATWHLRKGNDLIIGLEGLAKTPGEIISMIAKRVRNAE